LGGGEAPGGQVAADRRDRDPAGPSRLSDRQARLCPQVMLRVRRLSERFLLGGVATVTVIRSRLPVAHDRSLSRSVRSSRWSSCRWWRAPPPRSCRTRSFRRRLGRPGRVLLEEQGEREASPAEENTPLKRLNALRSLDVLADRSRPAVGSGCPPKALLKGGVVGAGGVEPPAPSVSAKPPGTAVLHAVSQVEADRRCRRETLS
jgi:hypothetical protein